MHKLFIAAFFMAGFAFIGTTSVKAHCGKCGVEAKEGHDHSHDHSHELKPYVKGETECCSAEHYSETQKKKIAEKAKKEYKEGDCCSAEHFASKKVEAAELAEIKAEYKKGETECCSADHYAKQKLEAAKKDK